MSQVGRISGPLLNQNLERNGVDLKFSDRLDKKTPSFNQSIRISRASTGIGAYVYKNSIVYAEDALAPYTVKVKNLITDQEELSLDNPNPFGTDAFDQFGAVVTMNDDYVVVTAVGEDSVSVGTEGYVYVFNRSNGNLLYTIRSNATPANNQRFGNHLELKNNTLYINTRRDGGEIEIWDLTTGTYQSTIKPTTSSTESYYIDMAAGEDFIILMGGSTVWYYKISTGVWTQILTLDYSLGGLFGSVAASGKYFAIYDYLTSGDPRGKIRVYDKVDLNNAKYTIDNSVDNIVQLRASSSYLAAFDEEKTNVFDITDGTLLMNVISPQVAAGQKNFYSRKATHITDSWIISNASTPPELDYHVWQIIQSNIPVLKLDVNNKLIGINTDTPSKPLTIDGTFGSTSADIVTADISNWRVYDNNLDVNYGRIFLNANSAVVLSALEVDNIKIDQNVISTPNSNANLELIPNGTGTVEVESGLDVVGNLHSTGNITADGDVVFGSDDSDTVVFNADLNSSIFPERNDSTDPDLGKFSKRWRSIDTLDVSADNYNVSSFQIQDLEMDTRVGNKFWVDTNGNDNNAGDHPNGAFKTLKHALDAADSSVEGPVTIMVMPGGYEEELPLEVPTNVTVTGIDFRNTFIRPTSDNQSEDVFLMNGESTVQNLTIKDFYYDSGNDKGYAFRFASNAVVTTRSPYIQNVSVITQGTTTSASDPRGFASADAGKGALVDGASVDSASNEASMLFHSVTFITPGVDALTMTNGVRVEWLNSFSYFADRGLYAKNGTTGHLSSDGSTIKYGAEIRSIGSASVYGNYGAVADGADCLMYLIQHNFAYIGLGKFVDNDPSRVIQSQEVVELNSGNIYYQSVDHLGNFRVGDSFFVDLENGTTSIEISEADVNSLNGLFITTDGDTTTIDGNGIDIGNFLINNNDIITDTGTFNIDATTEINLQDNTNITGNLDVTGNVTLGGSIIGIGNEATDTVVFNTQFTQNLNPDDTGTYNLGRASKKWNTAYLSEANIGSVRMYDTTITTNESNADLELIANGTGRIYLPDNNMVVENNLTVSGDTNVQSLTMNGDFTYVGDRTETGDLGTTNLTVDGDLDIGSQVQLEEILFDGNLITTTTSNTDLEFRANGTGEIVFQETVDIANDASTRSITQVVDITVSSELAIEDFETLNSDVEIFDNVVTTTNSNSPLELRAQGTGRVQLANIGFLENEMTTLHGDSTLPNITLTPAQNATINSTDAVQLPIGDTAQRPEGTGDFRFNTDTELFEVYSTTGTIPLGGLYSENALTNIVASNENTIEITVNDVNVGQVNADGVELHGLQVSNIQINNNLIQTTLSNADLDLRGNAAGRITIGNLDFKDNNIFNNGASLVFSGTDNNYYKSNVTTGMRIPIGDDSNRGSHAQVGETRYNTDQEYLEVYDGTDWVVAAGGGGEIVTAEYMEEESNVWAILLG